VTPTELTTLFALSWLCDIILLRALVSLFVVVMVYCLVLFGSADEEYTDDDEEWRECDLVNHDPPMVKLLLLLLFRLGISFRGRACSPFPPPVVDGWSRHWNIELNGRESSLCLRCCLVRTFRGIEIGSIDDSTRWYIAACIVRIFGMIF
jgi:hypothetical protein